MARILFITLSTSCPGVLGGLMGPGGGALMLGRVLPAFEGLEEDLDLDRERVDLRVEAMVGQSTGALR